jgi:hypothetical protein
LKRAAPKGAARFVSGIILGVDAESFDEDAFFRALAGSGARAVLIGRRALIALGIPVLTADFDLWLHIDDISLLNDALERAGLSASHSPEQARQRGGYVLENGGKVDVLVARSHPTVDGVQVTFDEVWTRRQSLDAAPGITIYLPAIDDLIATKRFGARPKDAEDIRLLNQLKAASGG